MDAIDAFASHVTETEFGDLPAEVVERAKVFLLDTLGVGVAGSGGPWVPEMIETQLENAGGDSARVWVDGRRLSVAGAAFCNAYQIHNSEFDCVHEGAVVHTMTVLTAALMAHSERAARNGTPVDGEALITALVLGVDVACHLGVASRAALRFFRPATAGAFAATAGLGKLMGFDRETLVNAFGVTHSQLCGTMQAHTEGSIVLGLQVGYNARNAVLSCDMAARGLVAPHQVLEGPFGYFPLFEGEHDLPDVLPLLGKCWRITEVAHKPFPSGRATHGAIDACLRLQRAHQFAAKDVKSITVRVPSLVHHLVGRPINDDMTVNYARLCLQFATARALMSDGLTLVDFDSSARTDPESLALGSLVRVEVDDNPDPNALSPVAAEIKLRNGDIHAERVDVVYGHPANPMKIDAQLRKLEANWSAARSPLQAGGWEALAGRVNRLEAEPDVSGLVDLLVPE